MVARSYAINLVHTAQFIGLAAAFLPPVRLPGIDKKSRRSGVMSCQMIIKVDSYWRFSAKR